MHHHIWYTQPSDLHKTEKTNLVEGKRRHSYRHIAGRSIDRDRTQARERCKVAGQKSLKLDKGSMM